MTLLRYADTKKPERRRSKNVQFKGIEMEREFLLAQSDVNLREMAGHLAQMFFKGMKRERDRLLREMAMERGA